MSASEPELRGVQHWMLDSLLMPKQLPRQTVDQMLLPGGQLDAASCLAIYQRSYRLRLRRCLAEQFPATHYALGEGLFCDFVDEYLRDCPPASYTLYNLGNRFSHWLQTSRPDAESALEEQEGWIDFLVDLTRYEWTLFRLFDAPGHEGQPWPNAAAEEPTLRLQPCLALEEFRYPVAWYYHAVRNQKTPQPPPPAPTYLAILRHNYRVVTFPVSAFHYRFLHQVQTLGNVAAALEAMAQSAGRPLAEVSQSWRTQVKAPWIEAGFFVHVEEKATPAPSANRCKTKNVT